MAKLGQVGVGLNIAQNHFSDTSYVHRKSYLVIIFPNSDRKLAKSEFTSSLAHRKSYLLIICPNSHEKLTKSEIMSSWSLFEHCSESLVLPIGSHI